MATILIHNAVTGESIEREMTPEEEAQRDADVAASAAAAQAEAAAVAEKAAARAALLARLGLSEDEARLLLGGTV